MTLEVAEFIRRFLLHVLPKGFHRIRHYGLLAGTAKSEAIAKAREMLAAAVKPDTPETMKAWQRRTLILVHAAVAAC
jgi:hypothetical protein